MTTIIKKRNDRQDAIRDVVRSENVRTQRALADALHERGFDCTQATVSRDIAEVGLCKRADGSYVLAEDLHLQRMVRDLVVDVRRANNLVVVHASSGTAQGVAAALDAAELPDLLGSVAGDDTILVVAADERAAEEFVALVSRIREDA
jgi:transcriptional regulator of arginine metabolism